MKDQLKEAVDFLCTADDDDYKAMTRTLRSLRVIPLKCQIVTNPELNVILELSDERFASLLEIVAVRRDKMTITPSKAWRREYMKEYMRRRRAANPKRTTAGAVARTRKVAS